MKQEQLDRRQSIFRRHTGRDRLCVDGFFSREKSILEKLRETAFDEWFGDDALVDDPQDILRPNPLTT